jgi:putative salt-induced outer membrane protein YdiY
MRFCRIRLEHNLLQLARLGWSLGLWSLAANLGRADTYLLYLRNGDRITGAIIAEDANRVIISAFGTNRIELPISQIERREKPPITNQQQQRLDELLVLYRADKITPAQYHQQRAQLLAAPTEAKPAPEAKPATEPAPVKTPEPGLAHPQAPGQPITAPQPIMPRRTLRQRLLLENWHGSLQVGLNLGFGTLESQTFNGRLQAAYAKRQFRHSLDYLAAYGRTEGVLSANRMDGSLKTELDLKKELRLYTYHLGAAGYDQVRRIDLSYQEGAGLGYHLLQRSNLVANVEAGVNLQGYRYATKAHTDFVSVRVGQDMTWRILPKLLLTQKAQIIPNVDDLGDYKLRLDAAISYPFMKNLTLNVSLIDQYDSKPQPNVEPNDLQIISTIGFAF